MDITQKDWEIFKQTGLGKTLFQYLEKNQKEYKNQILNIVTSSQMGEKDIERLKWLQTANCIVNSLLNVTIGEITEYLGVNDEL